MNPRCMFNAMREDIVEESVWKADVLWNALDVVEPYHRVPETAR